MLTVGSDVEFLVEVNGATVHASTVYTRRIIGHDGYDAIGEIRPDYVEGDTIDAFLEMEERIINTLYQTRYGVIITHPRYSLGAHLHLGVKIGSDKLENLNLLRHACYFNSIERLNSRFSKLSGHEYPEWGTEIRFLPSGFLEYKGLWALSSFLVARGLLSKNGEESIERLNEVYRKIKNQEIFSWRKTVYLDKPPIVTMNWEYDVIPKVCSATAAYADDKVGYKFYTRAIPIIYTNWSEGSMFFISRVTWRRENKIVNEEIAKIAKEEPKCVR